MKTVYLKYTFDAINMDTKEFLIYSFKYHLLQNELLGIPS